MRRPLALPMAVACLAALKHLGCSPSDPKGPEPDTDGDGLSDAEELKLYGTSPILADTDGDGFSDGDEVIRFAFDPVSDPYRFNPRIADVPQMVVTIVGPPIVTIQTSDENGVTNTFGTSHANTVTQGDTVSTTTSNGRSDTFAVSQTDTHEQSVTFPLTVVKAVPFPLDGLNAGTVFDGPDATSLEDPADAGTEGETDANIEDAIEDAGADAADAADAAEDADSASEGTSSGPTITLTDSVSTTVSPSTTFDTSIQFTDEQMRQNAETLTEEQAYAQSHVLTSTLGFLKVAAIIENRSDLAFRVTNVLLSAAFVDGSGVVVPIQNLDLDQGIISTFQPFSLAPGEQTGITNFISNPLTLETTQALLANAHQLVIHLATYELSDATGKSFSFNLTEVAAKTALIILDYGHLRPTELYQVATNLDPSHQGVTASRVFDDILRIPYAADKETGLTQVRKLGVDASGAPHWRVVRVHKDGPDVVSTPYGPNGEAYDFGAIELHAGDILYLALLGPNDVPASGGLSGQHPALGKGPTTDGGLRVTRP